MDTAQAGNSQRLGVVLVHDIASHVTDREIHNLFSGMDNVASVAIVQEDDLPCLGRLCWVKVKDPVGTMKKLRHMEIAGERLKLRLMGYLYPGSAESPLAAKERETAMTGDDTQPERRKHRRFKVRRSVYAFLQAIPAIVVDVSRGGAGLHYYGRDDSAGGMQRLDVASFNDNCFLRELPIEVVSDQAIMTENSCLPNGCRRCGVKFNNLSLTQQALWNIFLDDYTIRRE
ncbi:MAG: PilZ domain-containing protein [Deltaproteobacteria bacterium]|nr:PilZ domain-containing protein [Deltaproteobacteria bacterium]